MSRSRSLSRKKSKAISSFSWRYDLLDSKRHQFDDVILFEVLRRSIYST